jgi:hypothetical protein
MRPCRARRVRICVYEAGGNRLRQVALDESRSRQASTRIGHYECRIEVSSVVAVADSLAQCLGRCDEVVLELTLAPTRLERAPHCLC